MTRDGNSGTAKTLGSAAAGIVLAGLGSLIERHRPHLAPPVEHRALRLADAAVSLTPVVVVTLFAGALFGLGWVLADLWYVGVVLLFVAGIGFVVWCTRVIPWPRE